MVAGLSFIIPKNSEKYIGELFWTRKTFAPPKYDVVLMGDSRVYRGISPQVMKPFLPNLKILNFAYSNGGLNPAMYNAAENKMAENNKPKVVVIGVSANTITGYSEGNEQFRQELNRPREEIIERMYLNPVRYWFSATSPENLKAHFQQKSDSSFYRNTYFMDGYVKSEKYPEDTTEAIPHYTDDFKNYKVEEKYLKNLFRQVANWRSKEMIVVGFRPPVSQPMRELEDSLGLFDESEIKAGFEKAGGFWMDLNPSHYKTYDGSHLTIESASNLSEDIGRFIKKIIE